MVRPVQEYERILDEIAHAVAIGLSESEINTLTKQLSMVISEYESKRIHKRRNDPTEQIQTFAYPRRSSIERCYAECG